MKKIVVAVLFLAAGCASGPLSRPSMMFDDFSYSSPDQLAAHGWTIRTAPGWPGIAGAAWGKESFSFVDDPQQSGNRLLRMTSVTNGSATRQTQLCHERKYLEGTYAARVRFTDQPQSGPNGDQVVETFYMISPLKAPMDPDYSETDFEYLPNGGWGHTLPTIFFTTWETFQLEPWKADNVSANREGALAGWHTLVEQVADQKVRYFVDGVQLAEHGDRFYPESLMSMNFNLWFIRDHLIDSHEERVWIEDVDWVFHRTSAVLSPAEVEAEIAALRAKNVKFTDTVRGPNPPLPSPCNF